MREGGAGMREIRRRGESERGRESDRARGVRRAGRGERRRTNVELNLLRVCVRAR